MVDSISDVPSSALASSSWMFRCEHTLSPLMTLIVGGTESFRSCADGSTVLVLMMMLWLLLMSSLFTDACSTISLESWETLASESSWSVGTLGVLVAVVISSLTLVEVLTHPSDWGRRVMSGLVSGLTLATVRWLNNSALHIWKSALMSSRSTDRISADCDLFLLTWDLERAFRGQLRLSVLTAIEVSAGWSSGGLSCTSGEVSGSIANDSLVSIVGNTDPLDTKLHGVITVKLERKVQCRQSVLTHYLLERALLKADLLINAHSVGFRVSTVTNDDVKSSTRSQIS